MATNGSYRQLDPDKIAATLILLGDRINRRFPAAGLYNVCVELTDITRVSHATLEKVRRADPWLKVAGLSVFAIGLALLVLVLSIFEVKREAENFSGMLQGIDAGMNILLLMGGMGLFLSTLQGRWSRQRALDGLYELRSIVHVIDMHQLTKDPSGVATVAQTAELGPGQRQLTIDELETYLDFCAELFSLAGKVAALYAQSTRDALVIEVVSDIERLTASLSQKVWQKITVVQQLRAASRATGGAVG
ncbi:MAG TPA: hypothetical protein PK970_03535 [Hyphomicrobiaceae bacterium]|nr:hypothetical protein [Hyphomicrobiaceae bacterium]